MYAMPAPNWLPSLEENSALFFRASPFQGRLFAGKDSASHQISDSTQSTRRLIARAYYIGKASATCDNGDPIPALYRLEADNAGGPKSTELIQGIESLQVQYAIHTGGDTVQYQNAPAASDWADVIGVRFWLLVRARCADPKVSNTTTYEMGNETFQADDHYLRNLLSATVAVRNR